MESPEKLLDLILAWADAHYQSHDEWPGATAPNSLPASWQMMDPALLTDQDLPGGAPLAQLFAKHRVNVARPAQPAVTVELFRAWLDYQLEQHDE